ncbi:MAG: phosphotransferase [Burkholderiales bacterium]|uniref:aminoglycoside phosphotransferase family protein n=1 Tax=Inhella sp. TaxID=1921806 RepID=UPI001AC61556|nr:phosphotransferase [Burkholderiales bacterium]
MPPTPTFFDASREAQLRAWLPTLPQALNLESLQLAASDASPRRYWRVRNAQGDSYVVMDAPPAHNELTPFLDVMDRLLAAQVLAPRCHAQEGAQGFLLLSDLGQHTYLPALQQAQAAGDARAADRLMRAAIESLVRLQAGAPTQGLPPYSEEVIRRELDLFPVWCVEREHGIQWGERERGHWEAVCAALVRAFAEQPQVLVHCDYMPRNLMQPLAADAPPGVLDFQDALHGPAGYDLVSLLRDAFISWEEAQELDWAVRYWEAARRAGIGWSADFGDCWRLMEWTALQRHLRILGIFCRLKHRDGKAHYADDLPRFFAYAVKTATRYRELAPLLPLLEGLRPGVTQQAYG